ncbi:MAG: hypothetical protein WD533_09070 [Dehalococcoidia bacterium]
MSASSHDCAFIRLYGDTVLGRTLSRKVCDMDRDGGHYAVCRSIAAPDIHAWAFAWGMAFALSKPEWAFEVLNEFHPGWRDPNGEGQWLFQIDDVVWSNAMEGFL